MNRRDRGGVIAGSIATHSIAQNAIEWATRLNKFVLLNRGFHWIQEGLFFR
jgi:hypothetical protein